MKKLPGAITKRDTLIKDRRYRRTSNDCSDVGFNLFKFK